MVVRIRLQQGRPIERRHGKNRNLASAFGSLLIPAALMAYVMGFWRLASDMGIAGGFTVTGAFSHWQVWMALAASVHLTGSALTRYGRGDDLHLPRILMVRMFPRGR